MATVSPPPTPASRLLPLRVFGKLVPYRRIKVIGGMRDHEHIYPHSPGAGVELLGRDLYKIEIEPIFDAKLIPEKYRNLWPQGLYELRSLFEAGTRGAVSIPTVGEIRAYAKKWDQEFAPDKSLSSEDVVWQFTEDSENLRLASSAVKIGGLATARTEFGIAVDAVGPKKRNLWDTVMRAIDSVLAYKDQFELYASLIESKLYSVLSLMAEIDDIADELKDPANSDLLQKFHKLWAETRFFYQDQKQLGLVTKYYTTRQVMSTTQIATVIYGSSEKASEILALNGFADPFAVPSGFRVRYYDIQSQAA